MSAHTIKQNIDRLQDLFISHITDKTLTEELLDIASGTWASLIPRMPKEPSGRNKRTIAPDILNFALKNFSYLYLHDPIRNLDKSNSEKLASKLLWNYDIGLSPVLQMADSLARISGTVLLEIKYHDEKSSIGEAGYKVNVITSDKFEALFTEDPRYPTAVLIKNSDRSYTYWDSEYKIELNSSMGVVSSSDITPNVLGTIPFVPFQNKLSDKVIADRMGGDDLYTNIVNIGSFLRELGWTALLQRGQPVVKGDMKNELILAPDYAISLEQEADFSIKAPEADLEGMIKVIQVLIDLFARCIGLPSKTFRIDERNAISAVSIQLEQNELDLDRRLRIPIAKDVERRLLKKVSIIHQKINPSEIIDIEGFDVIYRKPDNVVTFVDRLQRAGAAFSNKVISPEQYLAELYSSANKQEIEEMIEEAKEFWGDSFASNTKSSGLGTNQMGNVNAVENKPIQQDTETDNSQAESTENAADLANPDREK